MTAMDSSRAANLIVMGRPEEAAAVSDKNTGARYFPGARDLLNVRTDPVTRQHVLRQSTYAASVIERFIDGDVSTEDDERHHQSLTTRFQRR